VFLSAACMMSADDYGWFPSYGPWACEPAHGRQRGLYQKPFVGLGYKIPRKTLTPFRDFALLRTMFTDVFFNNEELHCYNPEDCKTVNKRIKRLQSGLDAPSQLCVQFRNRLHASWLSTLTVKLHCVKWPPVFTVLNLEPRGV
jgi:hypothetical protein